MLVLNYLKTVHLINQQNLTEETSHERIVCLEGKIYALDLLMHEPSDSVEAYFCSLVSDD